MTYGIYDTISESWVKYDDSRLFDIRNNGLYMTTSKSEALSGELPYIQENFRQIQLLFSDKPLVLEGLEVMEI